MRFVEHPWINSNTIEKRAYQDHVASIAVSGNTLCVLPTGMGKTSVAALVVANCLLEDHEKKINY